MVSVNFSDPPWTLWTMTCDCVLDQQVLGPHSSPELMRLVLPPQLDCDEDSPNFDEDGRDEYNEIHMLV